MNEAIAIGCVVVFGFLMLVCGILLGAGDRSEAERKFLNREDEE